MRVKSDPVNPNLSANRAFSFAKRHFWRTEWDALIGFLKARKPLPDWSTFLAGLVKQSAGSISRFRQSASAGIAVPRVCSGF